MYIQYITYNFSTAIGPHVCDSWNITKQKKIEKIMQCPLIKSPPLWYGSDFFSYKRYYYAFIVQKCKKHTFFEWNGNCSLTWGDKNCRRGLCKSQPNSNGEKHPNKEGCSHTKLQNMTMLKPQSMMMLWNNDGKINNDFTSFP